MVFGNKKKKILAEGVSARATITRIEGTGTIVNGKPRVKISLNVQPDGQVGFEAEKTMNAPPWAMPQVGGQIWVKYDPDDTSRVEFDDAKNDEMQATASAQAIAGATAGATPIASTTFSTVIPGQTVIDARNVPGLRDEMLKAVADMAAGGNPAELQEAIAKAMSQGQALNVPPGTTIPGATGVLGTAPISAAPDPLDQLEKLNELRKSGALTQAEFDAQKAKILGGT